MHDVHSLDEDRLEEYRGDMRESNRRYERSYEEVLAHTDAEELEAFWRHFEGGGAGEGLPKGRSRTNVGRKGKDGGQEALADVQLELGVQASADDNQGAFSVANPMIALAPEDEGHQREQVL